MLFGYEVEERLGWPNGRATKFARAGKLPHIVLPDGGIRFDWPEIEATLQRVAVRDDAESGATHGR